MIQYQNGLNFKKTKPMKSNNLNENQTTETKQQRYDKIRKTIKTRFLIETEYPKLLIAVEKAGYSRDEINKYLKYIALEGKVIIKTAHITELETGKRLLFQSRSLGNNLNQLTRRANQNKTSELSQDILDTLIKLRANMSCIEDFFSKK